MLYHNYLQASCRFPLVLFHLHADSVLVCSLACTLHPCACLYSKNTQLVLDTSPICWVTDILVSNIWWCLFRVSKRRQQHLFAHGTRHSNFPKIQNCYNILFLISVIRHWWGMKPGLIMPLFRVRNSRQKNSTDWAILAWLILHNLIIPNKLRTFFFKHFP